MNLLWIAGASFAYVFMRAFQQLNVQRSAYLFVVPTSFCMAAGDVFLITNYAKNGGVSWALVTTVGISSGLGSLLAMWLRRDRD